MSDPGGVKVVFIKKKNKGHGHHGGAWKVAYADFVTAMMALFIVLWLLTQSDQAAKEKISEYFRTGKLPGGSLVIGAPGGSNPPRVVTVFPGGSSSAVESRELRKFAKDIENLIKGKKGGAASGGNRPGELGDLAKHMKVRVVNEGALIELVEGGDNFLFNVASSDLKPAAEKILQELAPMLARMPNKIEIHGHTDARPFGGNSKKTNWELSFERGDRARRVLEASGIEKGKISSVLAHADTALYDPAQPYAPENRRLAILVVRSTAERTRTGKEADLKEAEQKANEEKQRDQPDQAPDAPENGTKGPRPAEE